MLRGWLVLLLFQLVGEVFVRATGVTLPGPVVGMALLLAVIALRRRADEGVETVAHGLLSHLSLLFVPAGVGIVLHARRLASEWPALLVAIPVSTVAALVVTGVVAERLSRARGEEAGP